MTQLHPCPSCHRHLTPSETRCPFCDARITRARGLVAAALVGAAIAAQACKDDNVAVPAYGVPPVPTDAGVSDAGS